MRRTHLWDKWARALPPRLLRVAALPLGRHLRTDDGFRWESARMLHYAFGFIYNEGVEGDYAEFGVYEGRTFIEAWHAARRFGLNEMKFHAYDSFGGLPEVGDIDQGGPFQSGDYAATRSAFDRTIGPIPSKRLTVTEGFFGDSLGSARKQPIAIAWVDCDLYESTVPVLDFLSDQLQDGSVLIFDDWFCFHGRPDKGEQRACAEWLEANPAISLVSYRDFHWSGRSFIVNRESSTDEIPRKV